MLKSLFNKNKASIAKYSNNNVIMQNTIINNPILAINNSDMINALANSRNYESIQNLAVNFMSSIEKAHPLQPTFSAKFDSELKRLISTPETEDAFKQYPKRITEKFTVDYEKYPYMDKSEMPWEYAYRTQTSVELDTKDHKEYLGDIEDPYPIIQYKDGMKTIITPPAFPTAVKAVMVSGSISVPIQLERKPCMEFGYMSFGTETNDCGFDLIVKLSNDLKKSVLTFKVNLQCNLKLAILVQKLLIEMKRTKVFIIKVGGETLMEARINEDKLLSNMFLSAPGRLEHFEALLEIEQITSCEFKISEEDVSEDGYWTSLILAASLKDKWFSRKLSFDDDCRCGYDGFSENFDDSSNEYNDKIIEGPVLNIKLHGVSFSADKYFVVYRGAILNNIKSVKKNIARKKKNILLTFKPMSGKDYFEKLTKLENLKLVDNS